MAIRATPYIDLTLIDGPPVYTVDEFHKYAFRAAGHVERARARLAARDPDLGDLENAASQLTRIQRYFDRATRLIVDRAAE